MMHFPKTEEEWLRLRHQYVSSTESSALFGLNKYITAFELATIKKSDDISPFEQSERMAWGLRLQHAIAKGISEDYGVKVRRVNGYAASDETRMGASFDYEIVGLLDEWGNETPPTGVVTYKGDATLRCMYTESGPGILEIKNVDRLIFNKEWKQEDGQLEAPAHIEIQLQHQLHCIERKWGVMGVLVGGNETQLVLRERDIEVGRAIDNRVRDFWALLEKGGMPPISLPQDIDIIRKLYLYAEPGKVYDGNEDTELAEWCKQYREAAEMRDHYETARKSTGARILQKIGDAERAILPGYGVTANTVGEAEIPAYTRKGYRNLRINEKKVKT